MFFDNLFAAADNALDGVFAGPAVYRAQTGDVDGPVEIALSRASIRSFGAATDGERDVPTAGIDWAVELYADELAVDAEPWLPTGGDEIVFQQTDASLRVYRVVIHPATGRTYEPLDPEGAKMLVYAKFVRTES